MNASHKSSANWIYFANIIYHISLRFIKCRRWRKRTTKNTKKSEQREKSETRKKCVKKKSNANELAMRPITTEIVKCVDAMKESEREIERRQKTWAKKNSLLWTFSQSFRLKLNQSILQVLQFHFVSFILFIFKDYKTVWFAVFFSAYFLSLFSETLTLHN